VALVSETEEEETAAAMATMVGCCGAHRQQKEQ
jgi:hypothetical protein